MAPKIPKRATHTINEVKLWLGVNQCRKKIGRKVVRCTFYDKEGKAKTHRTEDDANKAAQKIMRFDEWPGIAQYMCTTGVVNKIGEESESIEAWYSCAKKVEMLSEDFPKSMSDMKDVLRDICYGVK